MFKLTAILKHKSVIMFRLMLLLFKVFTHMFELFKHI